MKVYTYIYLMHSKSNKNTKSKLETLTSILINWVLQTWDINSWYHKANPYGLALINLIWRIMWSYFTYHLLAFDTPWPVGTAVSISWSPFRGELVEIFWRACRCSNCSYHNASATLITGLAELGSNAAEKIGNHSHLLGDIGPSAGL